MTSNLHVTQEPMWSNVGLMPAGFWCRSAQTLTIAQLIGSLLLLLNGHSQLEVSDIDNVKLR